MGNSHNSKNIRFNLNAEFFRGSIIISFEPYIISRIHEEIESFTNSLVNKKDKKGVYIKKKEECYEINLKAFPAICNKVFSVLKNS